MGLRHAVVIVMLSVVPPLSAQSVSSATSGTTALLQAVSPVNDRIVWVSGHRGTILRSLDGGVTWQLRRIPDTDSLEFRDLHAASANVAWVMSAGPGAQSQIWLTRDGGVTWVRQFVNTDPAAFYDCLAFFDENTAVAFSDASRGRTNILRTTDAGGHWSLLPVEAVPAPLEGEGAFAASGGCVATLGSRTGWIALGGPGARLFRSHDAGATWTASATPIVHGKTAGNTAIQFTATMTGMVVGGNIGNYARDTSSAVVAVSPDGGDSWTLRPRPPRAGALFGMTWVPEAGSGVALVAGPGGLFVTDDAGASWRTLDERSFWSVAAWGRRAWAVGPGGVIVTATF